MATTTATIPGTTSPRAPASAVEAMAEATPVHRDRVVDLLRAFSIAVVVLWHWTFSITHWRDGSLRMPNPIGDVPGLWAATWVLQVMPLFFLVGGYANLAGWRSIERDSAAAGHLVAARRFWQRRFSRLLKPVGLYVGCWAVADLLWQLNGGTGVLTWGMVVFVPLWFLGIYMAVVAVVPWTARRHAARPVATTAMLGTCVVAADAVRFTLGWEAAGLVGTAFVWVFCHQLGYWWHDWSQTGGTVRRGWVLVTAGVGGLVLATRFGPYPRSMVAVRGEDVSNMFPTTLPIAVLAMVQLGLVLVLRQPLSRWLERKRVWKTVIMANAVAMTIFCWHMTALVGFLFAYEALGFTLADQATAAWWLTRPVWVLGPALFLAGLAALFAPFELPRKGPAGHPAR